MPMVVIYWIFLLSVCALDFEAVALRDDILNLDPSMPCFESVKFSSFLKMM